MCAVYHMVTLIPYSFNIVDTLPQSVHDASRVAQWVMEATPNGKYVYSLQSIIFVSVLYITSVPLCKQ